MKFYQRNPSLSKDTATSVCIKNAPILKQTLNLKQKTWAKALTKLERALWDLSHSFSEKHAIVWLPVICPRCLGLLSQKTASTHLTCLTCGHEWTLTETASDE